MPPAPERELASLDRLVADAAAWLAADADRLGEANAAVSHWSPRMHLDHAALATSSVCGAVRRILAGDPRCVEAGPPVAALAAILAAGAIPRGAADAPAPMKPPPDVTHAAACAHLAECRTALDALGPLVDQVQAATRRYPHFALGPMTAAEWIRFARIHFEHHVAIARDAARR